MPAEASKGLQLTRGARPAGVRVIEPPAWSNDMDVQRLMDVEAVAALLGRSPETIKKDIRRNPLAVPPRLHVPGTRLLRWRPCDVQAWLDECAGKTQRSHSRVAA